MLPFQIDRAMANSSQQLATQWVSKIRAAGFAAQELTAARVCEKLGSETRRVSLPEHSNPEIATPAVAAARVFAWLGCLVLCCCCLAGCGRGPRAAAAPPAGSGTHAAPAAKAVEIQEDPVKTGIESADAALASKVRAGFAADPRLRQLPIEVDAEAGRVTLWGHIDRAEQRVAAEQQARRTPGVTSIVNLIKVGG
jgi:BON domain-containing protein